MRMVVAKGGANDACQVGVRQCSVIPVEWNKVSWGDLMNLKLPGLREDEEYLP